MISPYSLGAQNAKTAFGVFVDGDILVGSILLTTTDVAIGVAHGLSATPDWVLLMSSGTGANNAQGLSWTANATTLTLAKVDTGSQSTISYMAGNLT